MTEMPEVPRLWKPLDDPKPDYPGDPGSRNKRPRGTGKPVHFPRKGKQNRFQRFLWELVNQLHRINLGLAYFKTSRIAGAPTDVARKPYDDAVEFYRTTFYMRWKNELDNPSTDISPVISAEGYVVDVRVISKAFSDKKPTQSSSQTVVYPYPSSSSSSFSPPP